MWKDALQDLGNPFDQEGNLKEGDELQTALEIQSWNNWLSKQTDYSTDFEEFDKEYKNIKNILDKSKHILQTESYQRILHA